MSYRKTLLMLVGFLTLWSISESAQARDLRLIDRSENGISLYVDQHSIQRRGDRVTAWLEETKYDPSGELIYHVSEQVAVDCYARNYRVQSIYVHADRYEGVEDAIYEPGIQGRVLTPPPESIDDALIRNLCR